MGFINKLLKEARKSERLQRHATLVLRGGAPVAIGYNRAGRHSEVVALSKLWPSKRRGVDILNLRLTPGNKVANSKPCAKCMEYLKKAGVARIYWTTSEGIECL